MAVERRGAAIRIAGLRKEYLSARGHVLALERERRALRVVFVVGAGALRRFDDAGELTLQRGQPGHGALARGGQCRACIS